MNTRAELFKQILILAFLATLTFLGMLQARAAEAPKIKEVELATFNTNRVPHVVIVDSINMGVQLRVERALEWAKENGSPAVLIELDTPGGYLEVTRKMVQSFLMSDIPIIVHVSPQGARAASAGAMITMAAHYASMSPSTSIGAATPVAGGGQEIEGDLKNKITNDTVAFVEGIAEKRGRDLEFAKKSVTEAASLTASDALKKNVIDGVHEDLDSVWEGFRQRYPDRPEVPQFVLLEMNIKEQAMSFLSNPNVAYGLMAVGMLGLYLELSNPGLIVPGVVGVTCLALGAFSTQIIPIRLGAVLLLLLGLIFLGIELLTGLPTYGIAGASSLVMFFLSGLFLMDMEESTIALDPGLWIPIFIVVMIGVGFMSYYAFRALQVKLNTPSSATGLIGRQAEIKAQRRHDYSLSIFGELWSALPENTSETFEKGEMVEITRQEGLKLYFKKLNS